LELVGMTSLNVQSSEEWNKTFGGSLWDWGMSVQQTTDGGYIITGYTNSTPYITSFGAGGIDVWLIKTDSSGNEIWNKTFGGSEDEWGMSVQQTTDGGYILSGYTVSFGAEDSDVWLIKTDDNGNMTWNKTFDESEDEWGSSVQQTTDGGYIVCGTSYSETDSDSDILLIKTNANGDETWSEKYKGKIGDKHAYGTSVQQTTDGSYIVTGGFGRTSWDVALLKTDADGNKKWSKRFGGNNLDWGSSVQQTSDGDYIIAGYTYSFGAGASDVWLIKTDSSGNEIWDKTLGGSNHEWGEYVQQTTDGGYIITGYTASFDAKGRDVWLIKVAEPSQIQIEISGGFGIRVVVENVGETDLSDLGWSFELNGLIFIGNTDGTITSLPAGNETKIRRFAFGIGRGAIRVTVGDLSKTASFFIIGPFVILQ